MAVDNLLQFRASDAGVEFVSALMDKHSASRTEVLRAMFKVASQFPDRIGVVLAGEEPNHGPGAKRAALATAVAAKDR